jgi:hypothetical protein
MRHSSHFPRSRIRRWEGDRIRFLLGVSGKRHGHVGALTSSHDCFKAHIRGNTVHLNARSKRVASEQPQDVKPASTNDVRRSSWENSVFDSHVLSRAHLDPPFSLLRRLANVLPTCLARRHRRPRGRVSELCLSCRSLRTTASAVPLHVLASACPTKRPTTSHPRRRRP